MTVKKVWIEPGCILCTVSTACCPEVFEIKDGADSSSVRPAVDPAPHSRQIIAAAEGCPVEVIKYQEE
ncbi:MAG: ferredoxin [Candidatus Hydrogenedentota bacterium]